MPKRRRLLVYPRGNQCDSLSVYLDVADADALSFGWQRSASFKLVLICDADETRNATKGSLPPRPTIFSHLPCARRKYDED